MKTKIEAAKHASAPAKNASLKCSILPAPPLAMTGISSALKIRVKFNSKPFLTPSQSIDVSKISPAPRSCASFAHARASLPVSSLPPFIKTL